MSMRTTVKINCLMKKMLQNFGSILPILFFYVICNLAVNLAGFHNCLAEYTMHT